jgi:L-2-hydroxyglutarate oxidase LhgO
VALSINQTVSSSFGNKPTFWNQLKGKNSIGHQYLFPGVPITRLYFEREIDQVVGEYILYHPNFGSGPHAITNLDQVNARKILGPNSTYLKVEVEDMSATAEDYLFLRRAVTSGSFKLTVNETSYENLNFHNSRWISKASTEVLSEIIESGLFDSVQGIKKKKSRMLEDLYFKFIKRPAFRRTNRRSNQMQR